MIENVEIRTPATPATPIEWAMWHDFLYSASRILSEADTHLQSISALSLSDYSILITLRKQEKYTASMSELRNSGPISISGLSRCITKLQKAGFVEKTADSRDKRALRIQLTAHGKKELERVGREHEKFIYSHFISHISAHDREQFGPILARLAHSLSSETLRK